MTQKTAHDLCSFAPVIPVLVIDDLATALPLAQALVTGGLPVLEVTLRTPCAYDAIQEMSKVEGAFVGAGTVLNDSHLRKALDAGATFSVSPGSTERLIDAHLEAGVAFLPGAATASEMMRLADRGFNMLKFFPAESSGGAPALKSFSSPLSGISFCPTGGVSPANVERYLGLPNVVCVGGSWVAPASLVAAGDWEGITTLAKDAAALSR